MSSFHWRARVTVQDCLANVGNRFSLVILAAARARSLAAGASPLVVCRNRPAVTPLREIGKGKVAFREDLEATIRTFLAEGRLKEADKAKPSAKRGVAQPSL
jgi:DNA-directed RNA polymerase subunit omega